MSDMSEGPGWWIASDGKWYPPHLHPSVRVPDPTELSDGHPVGPLGADSHVAGFPMTTDTTKRRSRTPVAAAVSIVIVILLIVGAVVVFGGGESASAKVIDAVNSTLHNGTAHVTMNLSGETQGTNVTGTGTGAIDFTDNALQLQLTVAADGQQVPVSAVYLGGVVYETIPGLATIVPGKTWLSIDLSSLQQAERQDPSSQELGDNPTVMLQMLAQQGNTVVALGPSTLDGVAVNGYSVTVNPSSVAQQLKKSSLPSWMQQAVTGLKVHNLGIKVYVDNSGLLRSFSVALTESTGSTGPLTVDESLAFSDYGTPVTVTAPPAGEVESFQQLLQAAGTSGTASS